jgi:hypothetical protein
LGLKSYPFEISNISTIKKIATIEDSVSDAGIHTKNISDIVEILGTDYLFGFTINRTGFKQVTIENPPIMTDGVAYGEIAGKKYDGTSLSHVGADIRNAANQIDIWGDKKVYMTLSNNDTGWDSSWDDTTVFTDMTWANMIKSFFNAWKLTTVDTNVANCVWTGIISGETKSGASGYSYIQSNIDTGYQPYKIWYELATPIETQLNMQLRTYRTLRYSAFPYDILAH